MDNSFPDIKCYYSNTNRVPIKKTKSNFLSNSQNHHFRVFKVQWWLSYLWTNLASINGIAWSVKIKKIRILFFPQVKSMHLLNNLSGWSNFPPCKHSINSGATKRNKVNFSGECSGKKLNDMKRRYKWSQVCKKLGVGPKTWKQSAKHLERHTIYEVQIQNVPHWLTRIRPLKMRNNVTGSNWLLWKDKCQ